MIGQLKTVVLDARDIAGLSAFYTGLAGWTQRYADDHWVTLTTEDGWRIGLQHAPDHLPPRWPDPEHPQQAHLDFSVPDIAAATERAIELGATLLRRNQTWHTLADPAGHPFDLCLEPDSPQTTVKAVVLDCPDATVLSGFYSQLLGKPIAHAGEGAAMIGEEGRQPVLFQQVEKYVAPSWPDPSRPQQIHLDITVEEIEEAERAVRRIGAIRLPGEGENWSRRASLAISRALARLRAIDMASLYEAAATVAAQDHLYRQLARLVGLTVGEPHPTQRPVTADAMADAVALLGSDAGRPIPKTTLLATGIAAAAVGLPIPNPAVLKANGTGAAAIEAAAEALSLAAEIIATHRYPMARPRPSRRRGVLAHLTAEGSAIALGAQRKETTGGGKGE
jgi:catechol-2,3-dioxygenase